jgi:hypothetical protein
MSEDVVVREGVYACGTWLRSERADDDLKVEDVRSGDVVRDAAGAAVVIDVAFVEGAVHLRLEDLAAGADSALSYHADALARGFVAHQRAMRERDGAATTAADALDLRRAMRTLLLEATGHGLVVMVGAEDKGERTGICGGILGSGSVFAYMGIVGRLKEITADLHGKVDEEVAQAAALVAGMSAEMPQA